MALGGRHGGDCMVENGIKQHNSLSLSFCLWHCELITITYVYYKLPFLSSVTH